MSMEKSDLEQKVDIAMAEILALKKHLEANWTVEGGEELKRKLDKLTAMLLDWQIESHDEHMAGLEKLHEKHAREWRIFIIVCGIGIVGSLAAYITVMFI